MKVLGTYVVKLRPWDVKIEADLFCEIPGLAASTP